MKNNVELLEKLLEKIKNTPDEIIESAINALEIQIFIESYIYDNQYFLEIEELGIESENEEWKENLALAA